MYFPGYQTWSTTQSVHITKKACQLITQCNFNSLLVWFSSLNTISCYIGKEEYCLFYCYFCAGKQYLETQSYVYDPVQFFTKVNEYNMNYYLLSYRKYACNIWTSVSWLPLYEETRNAPVYIIYCKVEFWISKMKAKQSSMGVEGRSWYSYLDLMKDHSMHFHQFVCSG